jgi:hypothetical protein
MGDGGRMRDGEREKKKRIVLFHLSVAVVGNLPQLQEIWIWWSTPEVLQKTMDLRLLHLFFGADPQ